MVMTLIDENKRVVMTLTDENKHVVMTLIDENKHVKKIPLCWKICNSFFAINIIICILHNYTRVTPSSDA